ncbi:MAG TPA: SEC-C metal-binding domain-containing protein [Candidatus Saccharimonadales bacterium]|nr:SEC-C metal-binding domain-containing protein [Candidatus Saccharimonadales bacterium]
MQYSESHHVEPGTEEHELLRAYLQAEYRIIVPQSRVPGAGAHFTDLLSGGPLFIMDTGFGDNPLAVAFATRIIPLGEFWMTGGAGLPATSTMVKKVLGRLSQQHLVLDRAFTNPHKAALLCVRTLLESGASRRIKYKTVGGDPRASGRHHAPASEREMENTMATASPGRNSPCPCGSGKRFKRCCGGR